MKADRNAKVFGIGLSRTGTQSLAEALRILGYRAIHYPPLDRIPDLLRDYDAATDTSIACCYQQLDAAFPRSRFILTVRDARSWLDSCERHFQRKRLRKAWRLDVRQRLYSTTVWNRPKFVAAYQRHFREIRAYFRERPEDLLILDVVGGDGWEPLCSFLKKPVPKRDFPHCNISPARRAARRQSL